MDYDRYITPVDGLTDAQTQCGSFFMTAFHSGKQLERLIGKMALKIPIYGKQQ